MLKESRGKSGVLALLALSGKFTHPQRSEVILCQSGEDRGSHCIFTLHAREERERERDPKRNYEKK